MVDGVLIPNQITGRDYVDTDEVDCWTDAASPDRKASHGHPNCRPNCLPGFPFESDGPATAEGAPLAEVVSPWLDSGHLREKIGVKNDE